MCMFFLIPGICTAATVYLDNGTTGCSFFPNNAYNPATRSCGNGSDRVYSDAYDASRGLSSGDTLYIRAGEYYTNVTGKSGYQCYWGSMYIDQSNLTIQNYNNEVVWVKGGASRTSVVNHTNNAIYLGGDSNVVNGIYVYGCIILAGTNNTVQNCDLSGGWDHQSPIGSDAWYDVIRMWDGVNSLVRNCVIHDNYDHGTNTDSANKSLIMHENDVNTIVEHCHFYNPVAGFAMTKYQPYSGTIQATYRYNWFGASNVGGIIGSAITRGTEKQVLVYQNVFIGGDADYFNPFSLNSHNFKIYNNTFYNVGSALYSWFNPAPDSWDFFNNIIYVNVSGKYYTRTDGAGFSWYQDYNNYYSSGVTTYWYSNYANRGPSLSAWLSYNGNTLDVHSVQADPDFINGSGTFSQPSDFKRSSYPQNGRGGVWPAIMGAYITGSETIGVITGALPPPPLSKQPNPPTNLTVK
jgi:hypothetical protein